VLVYIYLINLSFKRPRRRWDNILNIIRKNIYTELYDTAPVFCPLENVASGIDCLSFVLKIKLYFHELV